MRVLSLFSGIGAYEKALKRLNMPFELANYCEKNPVVSKCYSIIHNVDERLNLGNIENVNEKNIGEYDLQTWSIPCTDFTILKSNALGLDGGDSKLYYDGLRILEYNKPKYSIIENVDNLLSKTHIQNFDKIITDLNNAGYNNYYSVLNASSFGVPQHRKRLFIVSIRKDIDTCTFKFPTETDSNVKWWEFINPYETRELTQRQLNNINKIKANNYSDLKIEGNPQFNCAVITLRKSGLRFQANNEHPTITRYYGTGGGNFSMLAYNGHVGGITTRQCFKLMGFDYNDIDLLIESNIPIGELYCMAGNSIVVNVVEEIFRELFKEV
jgi:DNA (cytosine-5)-methyltransferase 1